MRRKRVLRQHGHCPPAGGGMRRRHLRLHETDFPPDEAICPGRALLRVSRSLRPEATQRSVPRTAGRDARSPLRLPQRPAKAGKPPAIFPCVGRAHRHRHPGLYARWGFGVDEPLGRPARIIGHRRKPLRNLRAPCAQDACRFALPASRTARTPAEAHARTTGHRANSPPGRGAYPTGPVGHELRPARTRRRPNLGRSCCGC